MIEAFDAIEKRELHKSFNMGVGLVMIVDKDEAQGLVDYINNRPSDNVDFVEDKYKDLMNDKAYIIGSVVDSHEGVDLI